MKIVAVLFPGMDQMDLTGPFEVFCRTPDPTFVLAAKSAAPLRDGHGLVLTPDAAFGDAPQGELLIVPGGAGINAAMEDEETLAFLRRQGAGARMLLTVCTGSLLAGAAGLLHGRRATTHWASHHLLPLVGALPADGRYAVDGNLVSTAGVTAGFDGSLQAVALLFGPEVAKGIQLQIEYDPAPPFDCGHPDKAEPAVAAAGREALRATVARRTEILGRVAKRLAGV